MAEVAKSAFTKANAWLDHMLIGGPLAKNPSQALRGHTCRVSRYRDVPSKHVRKVNPIVLRAAEISTRTFVLVHVCAKRTSLGAMILPAVS